MRRVAIIAALPGELEPLVRGWRPGPRAPHGVRTWRRRHGPSEWVAGCGGTGVEAALRVWAEIEKAGPVDAVCSAGWAGALSADFAVGRAYRVSGVIDARTGERFTVAAEQGKTWLVTSHRVADAAEKRHLATASGAGLVDMEAAGLARLAQQRGLSFYCVKGVSDGAADILPDFNGFLSASGAFERGRFIRFALGHPRYWLALLRLGGNSRRAAWALRAAVLEILGAPEAEDEK